MFGKGFFIKKMYLTKSQRKGLLVLAVLILVMQLGIYIVSNFKPDSQNSSNLVLQYKWQSQIDSLKKLEAVKFRRIYPFNPNFITADKAKFLGLTNKQWLALKNFRVEKNFVNSAREFQEVTKVSDSLLQAISIYFKFPDWVKNKTDSNQIKQVIPVKDINKANAEELQKVSGVGKVFAERVLQERNKLSGFLSIDQIDFIWGLSNEVKTELKKQFKVFSKPLIKKVNINRCSLQELQQIPYINYSLAREIVLYRSRQEQVLTEKDLHKIKGLPRDRLKIIALYLDF